MYFFKQKIQDDNNVCGSNPQKIIKKKCINKIKNSKRVQSEKNLKNGGKIKKKIRLYNDNE